MITQNLSEPQEATTLLPPNHPVVETYSFPVVNYLLGLFFHKYQLMMKFVSQKRIMNQLNSTAEPTLRESLLLAVMAAGLRYCTRKTILDVHMHADGENLLATAATKKLETELRSANIETVQTLLILGDVETAAGHDMTGYTSMSMAAKLIFDLKLDLCSVNAASLTKEEIDTRYWMLWVASILDLYCE